MRRGAGRRGITCLERLGGGFSDRRGRRFRNTNRCRHVYCRDRRKWALSAADKDIVAVNLLKKCVDDAGESDNLLRLRLPGDAYRNGSVLVR